MNNILELKLPKLREKQIIHAKYKEYITNISNVTVLPKTLVNELKARNFRMLSISSIKVVESKDGSTLKALFTRNSDGKKFESVLMRYKDGRNSVCVSCMIGCPLNCSFCATGKMGFKANLSTDEIVDQVIFWNNYLKQDNQKVTNVVYMGMGEPLLNLKNVLGSINILANEDYVGLSQKRITISTAGIINGINELAQSNYKGEFALSLHSADQAKREKIMPVAKINKLDELFKMLKYFVSKKNIRITFEYILIDELNNSKEDADNLIQLVKDFNAIVNLIPYNKVTGCDFKRPSNNSIFKFKRMLDNEGIKTTLRLTMGDKTSSACGQLTAQNE